MAGRFQISIQSKENLHVRMEELPPLLKSIMDQDIIAVSNLLPSVQRRYVVENPHRPSFVTPLGFAVMVARLQKYSVKSVAIVKAMLGKVDPNTESISWGFLCFRSFVGTPLLFCVRFDAPLDLCAALLEFGADPNVLSNHVESMFNGGFEQDDRMVQAIRNEARDDYDLPFLENTFTGGFEGDGFAQIIGDESLNSGESLFWNYNPAKIEVVLRDPSDKVVMVNERKTGLLKGSAFYEAICCNRFDFLEYVLTSKPNLPNFTAVGSFENGQAANLIVAARCECKFKMLAKILLCKNCPLFNLDESDREGVFPFLVWTGFKRHVHHYWPLLFVQKLKTVLLCLKRVCRENQIDSSPFKDLQMQIFRLLHKREVDLVKKGQS